MKNCPNCGAGINPNENFCKVCGTRVAGENGPAPQMQGAPGVESPSPQPVPTLSASSINNDSYVDQELVEAYIGANADKFRNGGYSWNTFFFSYAYLIYRKMYLYGVLLFAVNAICITYLNIYISGIIAIALGFFTKKLYVNHVKAQVNKIKNENPNKSREQLISICRTSGGTSVGIMLLFLFISGLILQKMNPNLVDDYYGIKTQNGFDFDQTSEVTGPVTLGDLSINIPQYFRQDNSVSGDQRRYISTNGECFLWVKYNGKLPSNKDSQEDYLSSIAVYDDGDDYSGVSNVTLNKHKWAYAFISSDMYKSEMYLTYQNDKVYAIEYRTFDASDVICKNAYTSVFNSLRFKD